MQTLIFEVRGMRDVGCAADLQRAIARLDGVGFVDVCQRTGSATVLADRMRVTPEQIESVFARRGYEARVRLVEHHEGATS
jgi:copper chaperone CopZ